MPVIPNVPVQESIADKQRNAGAQTLAELIGAQQRQQLQGQQHLEQQQQASNLKDILQGKEMQRAQEIRGKEGPLVGVKVGDTAITPRDNMMINFRQDKLLQDKAENYSKRLQNLSGFQSALNDLENLTAEKNDKGIPVAGGVVTNPNAKIPATGKVASVIPDKYIGMAEFLHMAPQGGMESRKAIGRLLTEYKKSISGLRGTDTMYDQEKTNMGMALSDDPQLAAKAIRAMAKSVKQQLGSVQAGYTPDVKNMVHGSLGADPSAQFNSIYDDDKPQQNLQATARDNATHNLAASAQAPQGQQHQVDAAAQAKVKRLQELRSKAGR